MTATLTWEAADLLAFHDRKPIYLLLPSRELTYVLLKGTFEDDFPFPLEKKMLVPWRVHQFCWMHMNVFAEFFDLWKSATFHWSPPETGLWWKRCGPASPFREKEIKWNSKKNNKTTCPKSGFPQNIFQSHRSFCQINLLPLLKVAKN